MAVNITHVAAAGEPKPHPLLFVHGAWHASWCWTPSMEHLSGAGWDCYALDLRGHGGSPSNRSLRWLRIKHYATDIEDAVAAMPTPPIIVAHSMGSLASQRYLEGKWLPGAILVNPIPLGGVWRATLRVMRRHPLKFLKANATLSLGPIVEDPDHAADLLLPEGISPEERDWVNERIQSESYLAYLDMLFFVRARPPLVPTPVAVISGDRDRVFSVAEHERLAAAYGTDLDVIGGAAHDSMFGSSAAALVEAIDAAASSF